MPPIKKRKLEKSEKDLATQSQPKPSQSNISNSHDAVQSSISPPAKSSQSTSDKPESTTFKDLGIIEELVKACSELSFTTPTDIQKESIPLALQGRDIIGLAETGSGKTAAFALPILQALVEKPQANFALVLAPTRELAFQTSEQFQALGSFIGVRTSVIVGGMDSMSQAISLSKNPHIIIATPGRLLDHLENTKGFTLSKLRYLVMDEADRLLDMDFGPVLTKILKVLPRERKTYLFSATMTSKVESLQRASLSSPARVSVSGSNNTVASLQQSFILLPLKFKDLYLIYILHNYSGQRTIIFTRTVNETQRVALLLRFLGFSALPLHGQLSQSSRLSSLQKFRSHARDILVATDVAARGLDIPSVDLVLNFDLPGDSKTYIHRVGRTARAGKSGNAISFVTQYDAEVWLGIERTLGRKLPEYAVDENEVKVLSDRVGDAQREAIKEMKEIHAKNGERGARGQRGQRGQRTSKRNREDMDKEEG
ncbi:MAG: ribosomal RNA processing protein [Cirrosporium novae-zelandiae]|nr:MAG: ribosomal RNA processing protein [Cirrosporium novae-zelandiae]